MRILENKEEHYRNDEEFGMESGLLKAKLNIQLRGLNGDDPPFYSSFSRSSKKSRNGLTKKYD